MIGLLAAVALFASTPVIPDAGTTVLVETTAGAIHVGRIVSTEDRVVILDVGGKELTIERGRILRVTRFGREPDTSRGDETSSVAPRRSYPLIWVDAQLGFGFPTGLGFSVQPRRFFLGTVRYGSFWEESSGSSPFFHLGTVSFMAGATLKMPLAHATLSAGPSISSGTGRGRFLYEDPDGDRHHAARRGLGVGVTAEVRLMIGLPFVALGPFVQVDLNTFYSYGTLGVTFEFGRIASFRPFLAAQ